MELIPRESRAAKTLALIVAGATLGVFAVALFSGKITTINHASAHTYVRGTAPEFWWFLFWRTFTGVAIWAAVRYKVSFDDNVFK